MKKPIILIGGGGHCKSCIDIIEMEGKYSIAGIVDLPEKLGEKILGYSIIANDNDIINLSVEYKNFFISLGQIKTAQRRIEIFDLLKRIKVNLPVIKSPLAYVSIHAKIEEGTIIMHNAQVNANARIGCNCIINSKALIEHDVIIGNHSHVSTGAIINGEVIVEKECFIGSGAIIVNNVHVPEKTFIKASLLYKG